VNRRNFLRALLGIVAAPFVAKVATKRPTLFGFPMAEAAGLSPMAEPIVLGSLDYYGPQRAALALAKGEDGGFVATAGEWEPIPVPWTPDVTIELDAERDNVCAEVTRDAMPMYSWDRRSHAGYGSFGEISFDASALADISPLVPGIRARFSMRRAGAALSVATGELSSIFVGGGRVTCGLYDMVSVTEDHEAVLARLLADVERAPERNAAMTRDLLSGLGGDAEQVIRDYAACFKGKA
jgi:hypothetical protein